MSSGHDTCPFLVGRDAVPWSLIYGAQNAQHSSQLADQDAWHADKEATLLKNMRPLIKIMLYNFMSLAPSLWAVTPDLHAFQHGVRCGWVDDIIIDEVLSEYLADVRLVPSQHGILQDMAQAMKQGVADYNSG